MVSTNNLLGHLQGMLLSERVVGGGKTRVGVSAQRPPEQQDEGLRLVHLVMDPTSTLLDPEGPPLGFGEESTPGHLLVGVLGEENVSVLEEVVLVFLGVLNFFREVGHIF